VFIIKPYAVLPTSHYCSAAARMRAAAKEGKAVKKFEGIPEKSITKLKPLQKKAGNSPK